MLQQNAVPPVALELLKRSNKSKKDYWDIAALLDKYPLEEMLKIFKQKFPQIDTGFIIHSLTDFEKADTEPDPDTLNAKTWSDIKIGLTTAVNKFTLGLL